MFRKAVGHILWLRPFCAAQGGYRTQPRVSTLGIVHQTRRALNGRQIARPNKVEAGSTVQLEHVRIAHSDFCAAIGASFAWVPASLAPSGRTVYYEGSPGLKPWAEFCSPFGAGPWVHL